MPRFTPSDTTAEEGPVAWGSNQWGQVGDGTSGNIRTAPVKVIGLTGLTAIAGGTYHSYALKSDGTVWAWGRNGFTSLQGPVYGQLGDGTGDGTSSYDKAAPVQVIGLTAVTAIASGGGHGLALKSDGTVWAWGHNIHGQLGDGTAGIANNKTTALQVSGLASVAAIGAGIGHSLAIKSDGTVWAWGLNNSGQLGDGTSVSKSTPVQVSGLSGVSRVDGGLYHSLALKSDGTVWAWGENGHGELGDGTAAIGNNKTTPVQVTGVTGVTAIAAGSRHCLALKSDGTVWAWGHNYDGAVGNGTHGNDITTPVQLSGLTGVIAVAGDSMALKSDGTVWAWGRNGYGQVGDGTSGDIRTAPVKVIGLTGVTAFAGGGEHSLAVGSSRDDDPNPYISCRKDSIRARRRWRWSHLAARHWTRTSRSRAISGLVGAFSG